MPGLMRLWVLMLLGLGSLEGLCGTSNGGRSGVERGLLHGLAAMVWAAPSRTPSAPCALGADGVARLACQMCAGVRIASAHTDTLPPIPPILPMLCHAVSPLSLSVAGPQHWRTGPTPTATHSPPPPASPTPTAPAGRRTEPSASAWTLVPVSLQPQRLSLDCIDAFHSSLGHGRL